MWSAPWGRALSAAASLIQTVPTGCRAVHAYSQISHICETQQCLLLYTRDHGGYLLDKRQMGAVCINGLRTFLFERSGKSVK
ncbi:MULTISPECIES: YcxB family protein [Enterocloster]|uniref:YcxB family protein n=1 Tax=Enterocloster TaxID=2719313 RepID=UPI002ED0EACD